MNNGKEKINNVDKKEEDEWNYLKWEKFKRKRP